MASDLNEYFVTFNIYRGSEQVHTIEAPRSMIQHIFMQYKYPYSPYEVRVVDNTGNFRLSSKIFD